MYARKLLLMLMILCLLPLQCLAETVPAEALNPEIAVMEAAAAIPEGYEIAAQNDAWTLYLLRDTLALIMQNNKTGELMYSTVQNADEMQDNAKWKGFYQSGIVLEYIQGTVMDYLWANLYDTPHEKTYEMQESGFHCRVYYPEIGIGYRVEVSLDGNDLCVQIPQSAFEQDNPDGYVISSFYVYPFMGHSYMGENGGYMLIPDGQGAIIELKDNEKRFISPYTATVYGRNIGLATSATSVLLRDFSMANSAERAMMPVFGMAHEDSSMAYLSVIEEGDISASITASFNGASNIMFDWIGAKYTYRLMYAQQTGPSSGTVNMRTKREKNFNIKQHFYFLDEDEADYCGMAVAYRNHLDKLSVFDQAYATEDFAAQVDILGCDYENGMIGTKAVAMTTFDQAGEIYNTLISQGVDNMVSTYMGWSKNGYTGGRPTTGYNPDNSLGGAKGLNQLMEKAKEMQVDFYLDTNLLDLVPETNRLLSYSALKKIDTSTYSRALYGPVYGGMLLFLTPPKSYELAVDVSKAYDKAGVPGVSLSGITRVITDYSKDKTYYDGNDCAGYYVKAAQALGEKRGMLLENANGLLWGYANHLTDMPIGGSSYRYVSQEVPFMAIALSGKMPSYAEYVNFQANVKQFFLKLVEQGARPAFLVTYENPIELINTNASDVYSSEFGLYEEMIVSWYSELKQVHDATKGTSIIAHEYVGDIARVEYENGVVILINFSENNVHYDGHALDGLSYKVVTP